MIDRLAGREDFARLRREGVRVGNGPIRLVSRLADTTDPPISPRIAFAIPRSVGNAVVRNRIRRRIRGALLDLERDQPGLTPPGDHLIRVSAPIEHWSPATLRTTMSTLVRSAAHSLGEPRS